MKELNVFVVEARRHSLSHADVYVHVESGGWVKGGKHASSECTLIKL